ncbi:MAG: phosphotransferase [Myxococcales bacterium]|nr:phosphotransferase [Myxococcales bacterium]
MKERGPDAAPHALARLHAAHWNRPTSLPWASDDGARVARTQRLVRGAIEQLEARMGDELPETVARAARLHCEQLPAIRDVEVGAPQTVLHGDPTPRHWVMGRDGASLVDWQAMGVGSPGRDVARLLSSALPAVLRISQERRLLAIYCAALRCFGVEDYSVNECLADYRRGLLEAAARTVLSAARAQERVGQSAGEVEGGAANQLARMELALVQNEVLRRRADARPGAGPRGPSSRPAKPAAAPAGSSLRSSCCAA